VSWDDVKGVVYALAPTIGVSLVFFVVIRSIIRADSAEREAAAQFRGTAAEGGENERDAPAADPVADGGTDRNDPGSAT
jgi:flagellar biosynthesis/type III secretory pathway M-ring protein FliF/YscJ